MIRSITFIAIVLALCGCEADDQAAAQNAANRKLLPAWNSYSAGDAAEVRTWADDVGCTWTVIGRAESFVVFRHATGKEWELVYTNTNAPADLRLRLEK